MVGQHYATSVLDCLLQWFVSFEKIAKKEAMQQVKNIISVFASPKDSTFSPISRACIPATWRSKEAAMTSICLAISSLWSLLISFSTQLKIDFNCWENAEATSGRTMFSTDGAGNLSLGSSSGLQMAGLAPIPQPLKLDHCISQTQNFDQEPRGNQDSKRLW